MGFDGPKKTLMNQGIMPPSKMVVKNTINSTVLLIISTAISYSSVACYGASTVRMSAKATEPLIVPAVETMAISFAERTHFENILTE